ncbi:MAG: hypothetical protein V1846_02415 [Candidatus Komeilibacteria bacterium]
MPETNFEVIPSVESGPSAESQPEQAAASRQQEQARSEAQAKAVPLAVPAGNLPRKDPQLMTIEGVLAEGLDAAYMSMTEAKRQEFRLKGEVTAQSIRDLLVRGKATVSKIRALIMKWLQLIPGVNRFFLEQEAKIKADKIFRS